MKRKRFSGKTSAFLAVLALITSAVFVFSACPNPGGGETIAVKSISLDESSLELETDETYQLEATVLPTNATDKSVEWASSNTDVATVSSTGLITAVSPGNATITVTTVDGGKSADCTVEVSAVKVPVELRIVFSGNYDEEIDLTASGTSVSYREEETLVVEVQGDYDKVDWYLDGYHNTRYADGKIFSYITYFFEKTIGRHELMALVEVDGRLYSKVLIFQVTY